MAPGVASWWAATFYLVLRRGVAVSTLTRHYYEGDRLEGFLSLLSFLFIPLYLFFPYSSLLFFLCYQSFFIFSLEFSFFIIFCIPLPIFHILHFHFIIVFYSSIYFFFHFLHFHFLLLSIFYSAAQG